MLFHYASRRCACSPTDPLRSITSYTSHIVYVLCPIFPHECLRVTLRYCACDLPYILWPAIASDGVHDAPLPSERSCFKTWSICNHCSPALRIHSFYNNNTRCTHHESPNGTSRASKQLLLALLHSGTSPSQHQDHVSDNCDDKHVDPSAKVRLQRVISIRLVPGRIAPPRPLDP